MVELLDNLDFPCVLDLYLVQEGPFESGSKCRDMSHVGTKMKDSQNRTFSVGALWNDPYEPIGSHVAKVNH